MNALHLVYVARAQMRALFQRRRAGERPRLFVAFVAGSLRFFLDYGYFTYLPIYLALARGTSTVVIGALLAAFALGAIASASQAWRLTRARDPAVALSGKNSCPGVPRPAATRQPLPSPSMENV